MNGFAIPVLRGPGDERDIELVQPHRRDVFGCMPITEVDLHSRSSGSIGSEKIAQEAGSEGREYAYADVAALAPADRTDVSRAMTEMPHGGSGFLKELPPRRGQRYPAIVPLE